MPSLRIPRPATAAAAPTADPPIEFRFREVFAAAGLLAAQPGGCGASGGDLVYFYDGDELTGEQAAALEAAAGALQPAPPVRYDVTTVVPSPGLVLDLGTGDQRYGTLYCQTVNQLSDYRLKADIETLTLGLDFVERLRPVRFRYLNGKREHMGFLAQDVRTALLETDPDGDYAVWCSTPVTGTATGLPAHIDRVESLRPDQLIAPLVRACQQLSDAVADLSDTVKKQGAQLEWAAETIAAIQKAIRERPPAV